MATFALRLALDGPSPGVDDTARDGSPSAVVIISLMGAGPSSNEPTHEALVTVDQFETAADVIPSAQRPAARKTRTRHVYLLSGSP